MVRLIIAGTRTFNDYELMKRKLNKILEQIEEPIEIVSGCCKGADMLGIKYAQEHNYMVKEFPADWSQGLSAGPKRNKQMANYATHAVVFWDGKSKGTEWMIKFSSNLNLRVILYK